MKHSWLFVSFLWFDQVSGLSLWTKIWVFIKLFLTLWLDSSLIGKLFKEITIMKRMRLYMTAVVLAIAGIMATQASAQVLRDADFNSIGRINGNGVVRDSNMHSIGSFDADGKVLNAAGKTVGTIKQLEIFDTEGNRIGYINTDGTVRDGESNVLGYISINDGKVSNAEKQTIGFARGVRVDWIACYFFFHFFDK